jgi:hypothetical protein
MTYALSAALQVAIYRRLRDGAALAGVVGEAIFDAPPGGQVPPLYISIGPEAVTDRSDKTGAGAIHRVTITVVATTASFLDAKQAAGAVCDALGAAPLTLDRGEMTSLGFLRAQARRERNGTGRRIDLIFRASLSDIQGEQP